MNAEALKQIDWRGHAVAIGIGGVGGALFFWASMPLAWMMGSMIFVTVAALAGVGPVMSRRFRAVMVTILGVFLGSAFRPEVLGQLMQWAQALIVLTAFIVVGSALCYFYLRRIGGFDKVTAYFSSTPGGLGEMVLASEDMGGDPVRVSLIHTIRVITIIIVIPFWFRLVVGADVPSIMPDRPGPPAEWTDWALLVACAVVGWPMAKLMRLPAASLLGPMILSAAAHLSGITHVQPPPVPVAAAQLVLGAAIGSRFVGVSLGLILRTARLALGSTALLLVLAVALTYLVSDAIGVSHSAMILVLSPGGLAEMSLIALSLGIDTAFVSSMHMFRIMIIIVVGPMLFRAVRRLRRETES
ncbi:MAG: AbrB family transcriptional regulator [Minwuia sp.]|uniref:AbrB family transcriptional regulator n=1 Tax=Minwuia sp. TaxID=2493630 RepID=UPI003A835B4F